MNKLLGKRFQVSKEFSSTGFIQIVAEDSSSPHPAGYASWNYIVCEYDPLEPGIYGKERKITADQLNSFQLKSTV